jgi:hypothetical protein
VSRFEQGAILDVGYRNHNNPIRFFRMPRGSQIE